MPMPPDLAERIRAAGAAQGVNVTETIRALSLLLEDDSCFAYRVWEGPGYGYDKLLLDISVVGKRHIYNFSTLDPELRLTTSAVTFLDTVSYVHISHVEDERSPYVFAAASGDRELLRLFSRDDGLAELEKFCQTVVAAIDRAKFRRS
jgi:hypothetical protein